MRTQVAKWGNSLAVRLPRHIAEAAGLNAGSPVDVDLLGGVIRVAPRGPHYTLDELLAGLTPENQHPSFDDKAHGEEAL